MATAPGDGMTPSAPPVEPLESGEGAPAIPTSAVAEAEAAAPRPAAAVLARAPDTACCVYTDTPSKDLPDSAINEFRSTVRRLRFLTRDDAAAVLVRRLGRLEALVDGGREAGDRDAGVDGGAASGDAARAPPPRDGRPLAGSSSDTASSGTTGGAAAAAGAAPPPPPPSAAGPSIAAVREARGAWAELKPLLEAMRDDPRVPPSHSGDVDDAASAVSTSDDAPGPVRSFEHFSTLYARKVLRRFATVVADTAPGKLVATLQRLVTGHPAALEKLRQNIDRMREKGRSEEDIQALLDRKQTDYEANVAKLAAAEAQLATQPERVTHVRAETLLGRILDVVGGAFVEAELVKALSVQGRRSGASGAAFEEIAAVPIARHLCSLLGEDPAACYLATNADVLWIEAPGLEAGSSEGATGRKRGSRVRHHKAGEVDIVLLRHTEPTSAGAGGHRSGDGAGSQAAEESAAAAAASDKPEEGAAGLTAKEAARAKAAAEGRAFVDQCVTAAREWQVVAVCECKNDFEDVGAALFQWEDKLADLVDADGQRNGVHYISMSANNVVDVAAREARDGAASVSVPARLRLNAAAFASFRSGTGTGTGTGSVSAAGEGAAASAGLDSVAAARTELQHEALSRLFIATSQRQPPERRSGLDSKVRNTLLQKVWLVRHDGELDSDETLLRLLRAARLSAKGYNAEQCLDIYDRAGLADRVIVMDRDLPL